MLYLTTFLVAIVANFQAQEPVQAELERLARILPGVPYGVIYYDRDPSFELRPNWMEPEEQQALGEFASRRKSYPRADLLPLLTHAEPKVRVLAMYALYSHLNPRDTLPRLRAMVDDKGLGFASIQPVMGLRLTDDGSLGVSKDELRKMALKAPKTVGDTARDLVQVYLSKAHSRYSIEGYRTYPNWDDYWNLRKDRAYCLSWFQVALVHATGGIIAFQVERLERVRALRKELDALPSPDREWLLLWLAKPEDHPLVSAAERLELAQTIGPVGLIKFLRGEAPTSDPDMRRNDSNDWSARFLMGFLLDHAAALLRPEDADDLIALDLKHQALASTNDFSFPSTQWAIAAAQLAPDRAIAILDAALSRQDAVHMFADADRARVVRALWQLGGKELIPRVLDYFFTPEVPPSARTIHRPWFIEELQRSDLQLLRALLIEDRLASIGPYHLQLLARKANAIAEQEIVSEDRLRRLQHPYGLDHFSRNLEKARTEYPAPTAALEAEIAKICADLRAYAKS